MPRAKKEGTSKTQQQIYEVVWSNAFWNDVAEFRKEIHMPSAGFTDELIKNHWITAHPEVAQTWFEAQFYFAEKYSIPMLDREKLFEYVLFGNSKTRKVEKGEVVHPSDDTIAILDTEAFEYNARSQQWEELCIKTGQQFVKLYILDTATNCQDVQDFIAKNWKNIKKAFEPTPLKKPHKHNPKGDKDRDEIVYLLSKKNKSELEKMLKQKGFPTTKEILIARIMKENGYLNVTGDIVSKIVVKYNRMAKRSKF